MTEAWPSMSHFTYTVDGDAEFAVLGGGLTTAPMPSTVDQSMFRVRKYPAIISAKMKTNTTIMIFSCLII